MSYRPHPDGTFVYLTNTAGVVFDVSPFVAGVAIRRGRSDPLDRYRAGRAVLTFVNEDARFSPWNSLGPYGLIVPNWKLQVSFGATPVFTGYLDAITEDRRAGDANLALLSASDGFKLLAIAEDEPLVSAVGANEKPGARISRILTAAAWPAATSLDTGSPDLDATLLEGPALDEIFMACDSDPGWVLVAKDGTFTFWAGGHTQTSWTTSQYTFSDDPGTGEVPCTVIRSESSDDLIINRAIVTNLDDETTVVEDNTSIATFGTRTFTRTGLWYDLGTHGATVGQAIIDRAADSVLRIDAVEIVADRVQADDTDVRWSVVTDLELHDRVTIEQTAGGITTSWQAYVESIDLDINPEQVRARFGLGPIIASSQTSTVVAPANLAATPYCTSAQLRWQLTGAARFVDVKVEPSSPGGTGTWLRFPGGTVSIRWHGLDENTSYDWYVRAVSADGTTSVTVDDTFTTTDCYVPVVDPDDGTIVQPPATGETCGAGTRKIEWELSTYDLYTTTVVETGLSADDGSDIRADIQTSLVAGTAYQLCTRLVCVDGSDTLLEVLTDWTCAWWNEPATWTNSCARTTGTDDFEAVANDAEDLAAGLWLDWCPGPIGSSPAYRSPSTLAKTAITAGPGLTGIVSGPDITTGDDTRSLAGNNNYSPANTQTAIVAYGDLAGLDLTDLVNYRVTFWVNLVDWTGGPPGPTPGSSRVDLINLGNQIVVSAWRLWQNEVVVAVEMLVDDDGTTRWTHVGQTQSVSSAGPNPLTLGDWHRVDIRWDRNGDLDLTVSDPDGTNATTASFTINVTPADPLDSVAIFSVPPGGTLGQVMVWDSLAVLDAVHWWPLDDSGGALPWSDYGSTPADFDSGNRYTSSTRTGPDGETVAEWPASATYYAETSTVTAMPTVFTIAAYVYVDVVGNNSVVVGYTDGTTNRVAQLTLSASGLLTAIVFNTSGTIYLSAATTVAVSTGQWVHVAATCDESRGADSEFDLYIDGVEKTWSRTVGSGTRATGDVDWRLALSPSGTTPWDGAIAQVGVWDYVLSSTEIAELL